MKKNPFLIITFVLLSFFTSCGNKNISKEEEIITKQIGDSLSLTGKHGYYTVMFIVGRLKTMAVENLPFEINVVRISPELLEEQIHFQVLDSLNYKITYKKSEKENAALKGEFDKRTSDEKIQLIISKTEVLSQPGVLESLKRVDYMFKVYEY